MARVAEHFLNSRDIGCRKVPINHQEKIVSNFHFSDVFLERIYPGFLYNSKSKWNFQNNFPVTQPNSGKFQNISRIRYNLTCILAATMILELLIKIQKKIVSYF